MSDDTVPFGKYKGRPVEDMLSDCRYMAWLEAQPWFRERFAHLTRTGVDETQSTPEHNRLQALFLDDRYLEAFTYTAGLWAAKAFDPRHRSPEEIFESLRSEATDDYQRTTKNSEDKALMEIRNFPFARAARCEFERPLNGRGVCDVVIELGFNYPSFSMTRMSLVYEWFKWSTYGVEIKPAVADDYPAVLRQMSRNDSSVLFTGKFLGEGATADQFVSIFAKSGKTVVFKADVDRLANQPPFGKAKTKEVVVQLRSVEHDGKTWFVLDDAADYLGPGVSLVGIPPEYLASLSVPGEWGKVPCISRAGITFCLTRSNKTRPLDEG